MKDPWKRGQREEAERFTLALVETCVRTSFLEDLHAGRGPVSKTGDYSDVKVVDAEGEIPWTKLSRISDEEMKTLMIEVVDRVFTFLSYPEDLVRLGAARNWDRPKFDAALMRTVEDRHAIREGAEPAALYRERAEELLRQVGLGPTPATDT